MIGNFLDIGDFFTDSYLPHHTLIQAFEYRFDDNDLMFENENIVILCYDLYLAASLVNRGGNITIFCRNVTCAQDVKIDVSGKDNQLPAGKKPTASENAPYGVDADNTDGSGIELALNGHNGGSIRIIAQNIIGKVELSAK